MGRRSFSSEEGLQYISGDADGDGTETGTGNFTQLRSGGEIVGFEAVSYTHLDVYKRQGMKSCWRFPE